MLIELLKEQLPLNIIENYDTRGKKVGLVIVDVVRGFVEPRCGNLAPPSKDEVIESMVRNIGELARLWPADRPIYVLQDTHKPGVIEEPYPPHCEKGTGEEELHPALTFLNKREKVTIIEKDCINGVIGSMEYCDPSTSRPHIYGYNARMIQKPATDKIDTMVVVGICTDICIMQFVQTMLSVRNHGLLPNLKDIVVPTYACATYDLPIEATKALGLPPTMAHPREVTNHMGLYFMQMSGAILTGDIIL